MFKDLIFVSCGIAAMMFGGYELGQLIGQWFDTVLFSRLDVLNNI